MREESESLSQASFAVKNDRFAYKIDQESKNIEKKPQQNDVLKLRQNLEQSDPINLDEEILG